MIQVKIYSNFNKYKGQGINSAFNDHVELMKNSKKFQINKKSFLKSDIIHLHSFDLRSFFILLLSKIFLKKTIVSIHISKDTVELSVDISTFSKKIFYNYLNLYYKLADKCIIVNPYFVSEQVNSGLKNNKITYIPNYVDNKIFFVKTNKSNIRNKLKLPLEKFIVISVGQIQKRKGFYDFIETAKNNPHIHFIWIGGFTFGKKSSGYNEYKKIIKNKYNNILFTGIIERNKLNDFYNASDLFFLPSYNELFPMSILEAINCHLPLLLRNLDLYKPLFDNKYTKGNSISDYSLIINKFRNDLNYYKKNKDNSIELSQFFSSKNTLKEWEKLYNNIYKRN